MPRLKGEVGASSGIGLTLAPPGAMPAVWGDSHTAIGSAGTSISMPGVMGVSGYSEGVWGISGQSFGIVGTSQRGADAAVLGDARFADDGDGVTGLTSNGNGVVGESTNGAGVIGQSSTDDAVVGIKKGADGAAGVFANISQRGSGRFALFQFGPAGEFYGNVEILGNLSVSGSKSFKIDHPLEPANKYLSHSVVESPDMKNIYDGVVVLNAKGHATVTLPKWFSALNTDVRYQLTAVGGPCPALHIAQEFANGSFKIAGGVPGLKVSWQVTGIRQDAWARAHPPVVEERKTKDQRGRYLHPELYKVRGERDARKSLNSRVLKQLERAEEMDAGRRAREIHLKHAHRRHVVDVKGTK